MSDINLGRVKGDKIIVNAAEPTTRKDGTKLLTGDLWINTSTYQVWEYNGTAFVDTGMNIKGAKGDKGATGAKPSLDGTILAPILLRPDRNINLDDVQDNGIYWTDDVRELDPNFPVAGAPSGLEKNPLFITVFGPQRNILPFQQVTDMITGDTYKRVFTSEGPGEWKKLGGDNKSLYKIDCHLTCLLSFTQGPNFLPDNETYMDNRCVASLNFSLFFNDLEFFSLFKDTHLPYVYPDNVVDTADYDFTAEEADKTFKLLGELLKTQIHLEHGSAAGGGPNPTYQTQQAEEPFVPTNGSVTFQNFNSTKVKPFGLTFVETSTSSGEFYYLPKLFCEVNYPDAPNNPAPNYSGINSYLATIHPFNSDSIAYKSGGFLRIFGHKIL